MTEEARANKHFGEIFVVSDGTGETGANAVRAVMLQFQNQWRVRIFGGVRQPTDVRRVMEHAAESNALVVFSLVEKREAETLLRDAERLRLQTVDLLGPLISRVSQHLHAQPKQEPGLLHGFTDDYFDRVDAVEFAVRHDDGANTDSLYEADIVLAGVSRTSKTPLSMYLAHRGYKTGNVPLVAGIDPPPALLELNSRRVFGLDIDAVSLLTVRRARIRVIAASPFSNYTQPEHIADELTWARRLFRRQRWRTIDITGRAVEENAARIIELYQARPPP